MLKLSFVIISIFILQSIAFTQNNREFVGVFNDKDIYFEKGSVVRGTYTFVLVIAKPQKASNDDKGNAFEYFSVKCIYYKNYQNEVKCILSDRIYYYSDNTFRKSEMAKIEVGLNYHRVINDLYNKVK